MLYLGALGGCAGLGSGLAISVSGVADYFSRIDPDQHEHRELVLRAREIVAEINAPLASVLRGGVIEPKDAASIDIENLLAGLLGKTEVYLAKTYPEKSVLSVVSECRGERICLPDGLRSEWIALFIYFIDIARYDYLLVARCFTASLLILSPEVIYGVVDIKFRNAF